MLKRIEISNFKAIQDKTNPDGSIEKRPLILDNLASVNYLVGPNGCGKSSVLDGIVNGKAGLVSYPEKPIPDQPMFEFFKLWEMQTPTNSDKYNNVSFRFYFDKQISTLFSEENFIAKKYFTSYLKDRQDFINEVWKSDIKKDIILKLTNNSNLNNQLELYLDYKINGKSFGGEEVASGIRHITHLIDWLYFVSNFISHEGKNPYTLFLIEEAEYKLHPEYQKKLPIIFSRIKRRFQNTQFLISTHSPFIISAAAKEDGQKVYLIEGGQTVGLDFDPEKKEEYKNYNSPDSQNGFYGGECILVANKMLGVGINDYFPSTVFFCEESMRVLISTFVNRDDIKDRVKNRPLLIPAGGDSNILDKNNILNSIINSFVDYQNNKFTMIHADVKAIIDENSEVENKRCEILKKYPNSVIVIEADEQEKKYPERLKGDNSRMEKGCTDNNFLNFYKLQLQDKNLSGKELQKEVGKLKSDFAKYVGENMTIREFQEFSSQLYNCIFKNQ